MRPSYHRSGAILAPGLAATTIAVTSRAHATVLSAAVLATTLVASAAHADVVIGGFARNQILDALVELGVPHTDAGTRLPQPFAAETIIATFSGSSGELPDYREHLAQGGHVIAMGASQLENFEPWLELYLNVTPAAENLERAQSCNHTTVHPANSGMPGSYFFNGDGPFFSVTIDPSPDTTRYGRINSRGLSAIRTYRGGGTFTYLALAVNGHEDPTDFDDFTLPWLHAALGRCDLTFVPGPEGDWGRAMANAGDLRNTGQDILVVSAPFGGTNSRIRELGFNGSSAKPPGSGFGWSVAGSDQRLVVGAPFSGAKIGDARVLIYTDGRFDSFHDLLGEKPGDRFGYAVGMGADVNGDGTDDILVGAPFRDKGRKKDAGAVYVFSGADMTRLARIDGEEEGDRFGWSVAGLGNVDGDRFDDFVVGAPKSDAGGRNGGSVYVISGRRFDVLRVHDGDKGDALGTVVARMGRVDRDGRVDYAAGAPRADRSKKKKNAGAVSVFSGKKGKLLWKKFGKRAGDRAGSAIDSAGDLNGDGRDDTIIGVPRYDGRAKDCGRVDVRSGRNGKILKTFHCPDIEAARGARFGSSVAGGRRHGLGRAKNAIFFAGIPRRGLVFAGFGNGVCRNANALPDAEGDDAPMPMPLHNDGSEDVGYDALLAGLTPADDDAPAPADAQADLDVDADGVVTINDLIDMLASYGPCDECDADLDDDGDVDANDIQHFLATWCQLEGGASK